MFFESPNLCPEPGLLEQWVPGDTRAAAGSRAGYVDASTRLLPSLVASHVLECWVLTRNRESTF